MTKNIFCFIFSLLLLISVTISCSGKNDSPSTAKTITAFVFTNPLASATIDENAKTIFITVPYNTVVNALIATFTTTGSSVNVGSTVQVSGVTSNDFTNPVSYIVTAADGSTAAYVVTVTVAPDTAKAITAFSFTSPTPSAVIDETAKTISITVPYKTNVTALIATFITTGASVHIGPSLQTSGVTPNDFTNPVYYVVTAADGSTATYTVTVTVALSSEKAFNVFSFNNPVASGTIDEYAKTISLTVPYNTKVTALIAVFTMTGASVHVGPTLQTSGATPNDFTNPVYYVVTAADGSTATYTVTVTVAKNPAKAITAFSIIDPAVSGIIYESSKVIFAVVPFGTDLTSLVPIFTTTGANVQVGSTIQESGVTPNDFTNPVTYKITAEDSSMANYTVMITFPNYINLQSDSGDYIGQGKIYSYTQANSQITLSATGVHLSLKITGNQDWWSDFQVPNSLSQFQSGFYDNLTRYPFNNPAVGGLSWYGEGRCCNDFTGSFSVDKVIYDNAGNLMLIDLRFEQHCETESPALHGQIHWTPYDTTLPQGPVYPPPDSLWQPAFGSTPSSGNYIYLQSDSGDYVGQGKTYTYTPLDSTITVNATGGHFSTSINISGSVEWSGNFQTMNTISQLQPGYYGNLSDYWGYNPALGGLTWYGQGRGCNKITGWFIIDNVIYSNGTLTAIDLRFEQYCEGSTSALHGQIHWAQ